MVYDLVSVADAWHSVDDVTVVVKRMVMPMLRPLMQAPNPLTNASVGWFTLPLKSRNEDGGDDVHSGAAVTSTASGSLGEMLSPSTMCCSTASRRLRHDVRAAALVAQVNVVMQVADVVR